MLRNLRSHIEHAPGHSHMYGEFNAILSYLMLYRDGGGEMTDNLANEILATINLLIRENMIGRRPWAWNWETYFGKRMDNACRPVKVFTSFPDYVAFLPCGYCNRLLDAFVHMDLRRTKNHVQQDDCRTLLRAGLHPMADVMLGKRNT